MKKILTGIIVSNKMKNTVIVEVERVLEHPKYRRRYKMHKRYKAHSEDPDVKIGEKVMIEECKPLSKDKKWKLTKRLNPQVEETVEEVVEENPVK